jgi:putative transposase
MKGSRFKEEQIISILREQEAGTATAYACRKHGISSATFYKWKAKYGGLDVSDAHRRKNPHEPATAATKSPSTWRWHKRPDQKTNVGDRDDLFTAPVVCEGNESRVQIQRQWRSKR